ncbi:regulator of chromosome condensation 1/beta-lactamase-inhibitor protein II [Flammula alnicola]|nr:regulator of chromosome condensation 1/beta-lactamase-inhibitor protein II [Flammula alnicola]
MSESTHLTLSELPLEVLLDNVLPFVPASDLLSLAQCSKLFAVLCADDTLWKGKLSEDFNFSGQGTARTSGWKFIYKGLFKPRGYFIYDILSEKANGRLGLPHVPRSVAQGVPYPMQLRFPGIRIVGLVAGGMSFHALDSDGNVYVWGTLNGTWGPYAADNQGFSSAAKQARTPHKLSLPAPIRSISCGRLHSSCLDRTNKIWTFTNWGRPFRLSSKILNDPDYAPKQIECGWTFSSLLTKSGDVFVWWPFAGVMGEFVEQKMRDMDGEGDKRALARNDGVIPCIAWDLDIMPTRLPSIPSLPELPNTGNTPKSQNVELIQIAAFDQHIVGLTNRGHVLKYGALHDETGVPNGRWEYLPQFSEIEKVREHPAFSDADDAVKVDAPQTMKITHVNNRQFPPFVAYSTGSSSIVLIGDTNTTPESQPKIIPQLQNKSVISIEVGDYHTAALTANGKLLTWGGYSNGALGLGDPLKLEPGTPGAFSSERDRKLAEERRRMGSQPPNVDIPTEVRFDHNSKKPRERFCFATTAAGWHTGALVIDLEPGEDEEDEVGNIASEDRTLLRDVRGGRHLRLSRCLGYFA